MTTVAVLGAGAVGQRIARQLAAHAGIDRLVLGSRRPARAAAAARQLLDTDVEVVSPGRLPEAEVAVLSLSPGGHGALAERALAQGSHVVSLSDSVADAEALLALDGAARQAGRSIVVGAGFSPGYSCLLARHGADTFDTLTEVHIARMGTGGPACQRQLHRARTGTSVDWLDGAWIRRRGGSGRELVWFPDPLGARDCYRAALPDALLLAPVLDGVERVTARVGGTRRDRLTAMLPMLRPPHADGGPGAVRVELRGQKAGCYETDVLGVIDHPSNAAAAVAATAACRVLNGDLPHGAAGLAAVDRPAQWLAALAERGVRAAAFEGAHA